MNQEEIRQVTARDKKWVPTMERVKISTTNVRLETTFWYTIKKVLGTNSYEFLLENKKCLVDAEVFQKILDICLRVQGVYFTEVPDDETTLTFRLDLGYQSPLYKHPSIAKVKGHKRRRLQILLRQLLICLKNLTLNLLENKLVVEEIKKKVSISVDDNIIPKPDIALELGKSMSLTEAVEEEAARQLKGVLTLIPEEQLVADTMEALKASKKSIRSQSHAGGSSEGTNTKLGVLDESTVTPTSSSEGTVLIPL
ncbi:hypothetical protein Tco_0748721 [Tanacetum coccineum]|uniref:Uncharacterized protein n=1 Tax=Tanacetum coccineum TaxID=301880 RepID=A0ABQ4YZ79_9ASTR